MVFAHSEIERIAATGIETSVFQYRTSARPDRLLREVRSIRSRIRQFEPDVVHAHYGTITAFATVVAADVPVVITFRGSDLNPSLTDGVVRNAIQKLLSNTSARFAKAVILVSRDLQARLWLQHPRASVIPTGVDLSLFKPGSRADARDKLGWSLEDKVVLFNAGTSPKVKRLDLAEQSLELLRQRIPAARMEVLRGMTPHDNLPHYMNGADCLLLTSDFEGSPDIVKEALACNLPIVSVDAGDVRERTAGVKGTALVERNPEALANAMAQVLELNERSNGRDKIAELDSGKIRDAVIQVYRDILSTQSGQG
ncbi:MAG TPA: glycosyltransferase [Gemmatimonadaceae bacterium]|nr:glycosyltransferase [Gemmatimonadaceae bacterium]